MRYYDIPPDTRDKEKIIGGKFTLTQFVFLVCAVVLGLGVGTLFLSTTKNIFLAILGMAVVSLPFVPFAFFRVRKMNDMELFEYIMLKIKFKTHTKKFYNINDNYKGGE